MKFCIAIVVFGLSLVACSGASPAEQTLVAEHSVMGTQIADIRSTATIAADRLQITVEFVETTVRRVEQQNQVLSSTLIAMGGNPGAVQPGAVLVVATTPPPAFSAQGGVTLPASTAAPTVVPTEVAQQTLTDIVMAEAVGSNDCALAPVSSFTPETERIYVVATAANIEPGTTLNSRWFQEGQEVIAHDFTPDFAINGNCVWFFIDQTEVTFTPGNYSVQLEVNSQPVGTPIPFTIASATIETGG